MPTLEAYLVLGVFLFGAGIACILVRRNVIQILMGVELVLNASALNFVAFSHFLPAKNPSLALSGQVAAVFVIVLAAAEAVVALALILSVFYLYRTVHADEMKDLRG
ncbi:MAG TPA: NADH-quinone oxidoreductase subunit NuoK [Bdellovibrionota bacterium]|nr:NADH-quinone oxidoreductase subunit NuoK [Bdellovibrionota bacterium]